MKYLNSYNGLVTEGFFDFFKKTDEQILRKRELLEIITNCCNNGLTFHNLRQEKQPMSTHVIRNKAKGPMYIIINDDLTVSFNGNVSLYGWKEETFPFKFKKVRGDFHMERCNITSLDFIPQIVTKSLNISNNGLDSLDGLNVEFVGKTFNCNGNNLQTLNNLPKNIVGHIHAQANEICNYDGIEFKDLENIDLYLNPLSSIDHLTRYLGYSENKFELFKEFDPIRPGGIGKKPFIIEDRIDEFLSTYNPKLIILMKDQILKSEKYDII